MNRFLSGLCLAAFLTSCSKTAKNPEHRYARLTVIYGKTEPFGVRYFWETPSEKTEAMSIDEVYKFFGVARPESGELKVQPFDYKVIDHLVQSGWSLSAVSSTGAYKEDAGGYKDAITREPVTTYHFSK